IMKESAKLALTYCRTLDASYDIPENLLKEYDIHIHAPEGAVPKDGPSAGVTLATALVSAISGMTVRRSLAMTGEITLKGKVIAIGGLKEKLIAAYKEKIKTVIIPKDNVCDLVEIPSEVTLALKIIPVEKIDEVLSLALIKPKRKTPEFKHLTAMKDNADHTAAIPI
ncbi:MAG: S16 family serine protease, partial [Oscillospiraceae bacterium]